MLKPNPGCQLDAASAELVQETLRRLNRNANEAKNLVRRKRASYVGMSDRELDKNFAYLSGLCDATYALLTALSLDPENSRDGLLCEEYLINDKVAKAALGGTIQI